MKNWAHDPLNLKPGRGDGRAVSLPLHREPSHRNRALGIHDGAPCCNDGAPGIHDGAPCRSDDAPAIDNGAPCRSDGAPGIHDGAPCRSDGAPGIHNGAPCRSDGAPGIHDGAPCRSDGAPGIDNGAPCRSNGAPGIHDDEPALPLSEEQTLRRNAPIQRRLSSRLVFPGRVPAHGDQPTLTRPDAEPARLLGARFLRRRLAGLPGFGAARTRGRRGFRRGRAPCKSSPASPGMRPISSPSSV